MGKHEKTLKSIFAVPTRANISWSDIESLFKSLSANISEGNGSRIRVSLNEIRAVFHRPHPQKESGKKMVESVRRFLESAGIRP
ncbi:MAG: hexulose-6-phosphate isomerase [Blastopirellula sp.]|nr:MAG: hexulose-6-phosphate isomerase [Blastopirellula sp.]